MEKTLRYKRFIAVLMTFVVAFTFSVSGARMNAAQKKDVTYIKDFKLYIAENADAKKAATWFKDNDYTMIEGNLNADASGALKKEVGVYLGYSTTTNSDEAVRDIAVMNERGNYSVAKYETLINEQKKTYTDMVSDLKEMLEEYRINVNNNLPTAIQARDFMNGYKEDDSGKLLGDLLMEISDEDLGKLLMQANGQIVLMIQERLACACDTGKSTWLDRMVKLGSYKALEKKALKACNNDINKARKTLDKKYKKDAQILVENWEDVRQHITDIRKNIKAWGLDSKSTEEIEQFFEENTDNAEVSAFWERYQILVGLGLYEYEDNNLLGFFDQPSETFKGDGIRKLYPLVASLSEGQIAGIEQSVSIFSLVLNAFNAGAYNGYKTGETKELLDEISEEDKKEIEDNKKEYDENIKEINSNNAVSIYAGVDREVFNEDVAITSTALEFSNGDGLTWADAFVNSWITKGIAIGGAAASMGCLTGAIIVSRIAQGVKKVAAQEYYITIMEHLYDEFDKDWKAYTKFKGTAFEKDVKYKELINQYKDVHVELDDATSVNINYYNKPFNQQSLETQNKIMKKGVEQKTATANRYQYLTKLRLGLTIAFIIIAVVDIVATSITLYNYYNRDHLPIPPCMVEMSYVDEKDATFVNYKSVLDQDKKYGDVNGGGGKQWLALYQTHDEDAGNPILAPENGEEFDFIVQYGGADEIENYSPLHMFGTPNTPQNLTFADGEKGWSYNDGKNGTYLFFRRGEAEVYEEDEAASGSAVSGSSAGIGTASSAGTTALISTLCGVGGIFIGAIVMGLIRRKKQVTGDSDSKE